MNERPRLVLVAGPNGAGKSTYSREAFRSGFLLLDPDRFGIEPAPFSAPFTSGRAVIVRVREALASREDFVLETTLAGQSALSVLGRAKRLGYEITLLYVGLDDPDECLRRIARRVREGGHTVPEDAVRRRVKRSIENLPHALTYADRAIVYDNGPASEPYREAVIIEGDSIRKSSAPTWACRAVAEFERLRRKILHRW
jgi:predicted ABC-type ATPase